MITPEGFVPIQPATTESTDTAPTAPAFQQVTIYEAAVDVIPQVSIENLRNNASYI